MRKVRLRFPHAGTWVLEHVGTAAARFRLAISIGFVIAVTALTAVATGGAGRAEGLFSVFGSLFSGPPQPAQQTAAASFSDGGRGGHARRYRTAVRFDNTGPSRRRGYRSAGSASERRHSARRDDRDTRSSSGGDGGMAIRLGRASLCVRLCDGFAFPVGAFRGQNDVPAHEATCRSECPGAQTALYVLPDGDSAIADAVDVRSGRLYSQKAASFHYTTYLDESCTCHSKGGNRIASLLHDFTLRRGDAVVTASGVKVFHGGNRFPFRQVDFVRLAQSRDVKRQALTTFRAIERASLVSSHPAVAAAPGTATPTVRLGSLDHQASLAP